ncbi:MAG: caudovirus prohead protease [Chryseobacterium sp.]|nr:caudovirus prohead protease [Chryseobacterium sp.]
MPRFILNDENVRNSYGFKITTAGIYLGRFTANPVMLDSHYNSNAGVIGKWKDIQNDNVILSADTVFNLNDPEAKKISDKVEGGFINGASMGVSFKKEDLKMQNGELTLTKCELLEASIVAVPSNASALKLYVDGEAMTDFDIQTLCLSVAQETPATPPKTPTVQPKQENKMSLKLSQLAFIALGFPQTTTEASEAEINTAILALQKAKEDAEAKTTAAELKLSTFEDKQKADQLALSTKLVDDAIVAGRITADKRQSFLDLAVSNFDLAKTTIESIPAKVTLGSGITNPSGNTEVKTMDDFQKLSEEAKLKFKTENYEAYLSIIKNRTNAS